MSEFPAASSLPLESFSPSASADRLAVYSIGRVWPRIAAGSCRPGRCAYSTVAAKNHDGSVGKNGVPPPIR